MRETDDTPSPFLIEARRADRATEMKAWLIAALLMVAVVGVDILSDITDIERRGGSATVSPMLLLEFTSIFSLLALFPLVAYFTRRLPFPLSRWQEWWRVAPLYLVATMVFSLLHVGFMILLRKTLFPLLLGAPYIFITANGSWLSGWFYEYRKDLLTLTLFVGLLYMLRRLAELSQERQAANNEARAAQRLTVKCGGRVFFLPAQQVRWVKAAGNYVEIAEGDRVHLVRSSLKAVRDQLAAANVPMQQTHRSWLVNGDFIKEIEANGKGTYALRLNDDTKIPLSRNFRADLMQAMK